MDDFLCEQQSDEFIPEYFLDVELEEIYENPSDKLYIDFENI